MIRFSKVVFLAFTIIVGWFSIVQTLPSAQDLVNSYKSAVSQIDLLKVKIKQLPESSQSMLLKEINTASKNVDLVNNSAQNTIKPLEKQTSLYALEELSAAITKAKNSISQTMFALSEKVDAAVTSFLQQQSEQNAQKITQETAKLIKAKSDYQKKMEQVFIKIEQLLSPYDKVLNNLQQFTNNVLDKFQPYQVQDVENLHKQLSAVAAQAYGIYKNLGTIKADDRSSLLIIIMKRLCDFYNDLIAYQVQEISSLKKDDTYYKKLTDLSINILGTDNASDGWLVRYGYDGAVKNEIAKYFSDASEQGKMIDYYLQKKINKTYLLYNNALQTLAIQLSSPTVLQRKYARAIYNLIMNEIAVLPQQGTSAAAQAAHMNLALIYVNSALSLIKGMQLSDDTTPLVAEIIDFFKQASIYFSKAQDGNRSQLYTNLYTSLMQASVNLKQAQAAQKAGNISNAIQLYKSAQTLFKQGGDGIDFDKISILLSQLEGQYLITNVQNKFKQFMSQNRDIIKNYLNYIGSMDSTTNLNSFNALFSSLVDIYQTSYADFSEALQSYESVAKNNPALKQSNDTVKQIQNLIAGVSLLSTLSQAQADLQSGDQMSRSLSADALQDAEKYYGNAITLFQQVDASYASNNQLESFVPQYFFDSKALEPLDFTTIANRHIGKLDIELAHALRDDTITALVYYNDAHNRFKYLPASVDTFITATLESLSKETSAVAGLFADAQNNEKAALALTAASWVPKNNVSGYSSDATSKWHGVLQQYLTVYHLGYKEAKDAFINAVNNYALEYKKNVSEEYYPDLGVAMIKYRTYVMNMSENEDSTTILKEIEQLVGSFFNAAQLLINTIANPISLLTTATNDQEKLLQWSKRFEQALNQQEDIIDSVAPNLNQQQVQNVLLFEKNESTQENTITYSFLPTKKTVIMENPLMALASLYKQLGDYYLKQKNYSLAYPNYYYAKQKYLLANKPNIVATFNAQIALSDTLYLASEYRDLIIPKQQVTISAFQIPGSYDLKVYGESVPLVIANSFGQLSGLDSEKAQDLLLSLATQLYFYYKISDSFGADQFETIYNVIANKNYASLSDDQQATVVSIIENAEQFQKDLKQRVLSKTSNLVLQEVSPQQFALYEYMIPLPRFSDTIKYYQGYPAVINYYTWAAYLFKPGPENETITVGNQTLPHGNDNDEYNSMINNQVDVYLSQAYGYQTQIDALKTGSNWNKLKNSNKTDMSLSINDYNELYSTLKDLFNSMIAYYNGPLANFLVDQNSPDYAPLNNLVGMSYKGLGDILATFLIGDPLSHYYTTVLKDILGNYINAIVTYGFSSKLYASMAQLYNASGEILLSQEKYFDSLSFFYTAVTLLQRITPQTPDIQALITKFYVNYFGAMFQGATYNIGKFQKAYNGVIDITLSDGTVEKISFNDLLEKYLSFLTQTGGVSTQGLDQAELDESQNLKDLVLDALVFYNGTNSQVQPVIKALVSDANELVKVNEAALSLIHSFSSKNSISLDNLETVSLMMQRTDFPDGKDFVTMLNNGFDLFANKIEQSSDAFNQAVGYSAIGQFALKLYNAFGYLYMDVYLGGVSVTAETNLTAAITAEINQILSPSNQYIG